MNLLIILIIVLLVLSVAGLPTWGYGHSYGYYPSGVFGLLLIILLLFLLLGYRI